MDSELASYLAEWESVFDLQTSEYAYELSDGLYVLPLGNVIDLH